MTAKKAAKVFEPSTIGSRLQAERKRLRMSLAVMAHVAGVTEDKLAEWEASTGSASADAFTALAVEGLDVLFVVTGKSTPRTLAGVTVEEALANLPRPDRHQLLVHLLSSELSRVG